MKRLYHGIYLAALCAAMAPSLESQTLPANFPATGSTPIPGRTRWGLINMCKLCLLLLGALPLFATPPVVSNISFLYGSHSSVSVVFDISATGNDFRVRYIPAAQGSCDQGNAAATVEFFGFPNLSANSLTGLQLPISGLAANTKYEFCPEVSNDSGSTWSTTGGSNPVGTDFTTLPLPPTHPALPIHPATFDTSYPDTTQGTCWSTGQPGYCTVTVTVSGNSCTDLTSDMDAAIAHQKTSGTVIEIPAGSVCEDFGSTLYNGDSRSWSQLSSDAIAYDPSNVSDNTITLDNHGLTEGEGVVFSEQEIISGTYLPGVPAGLIWGYVYFVHVVDADHFQLYQNWEQETGSETSGSNSVVLDRLAGWASSPGISVGEEIVGSGIPSGTTISAIDYNAKTLTLSQAATATSSGATFTFGGPLQDIGPCGSFCSYNGGIAHFVPWPRQILYWIIVRTSTPDSQFAPEGTRVNPSWASKMVTIEAPSSGYRSLAPYVYSTHIRFTGIEWTWQSSTELSSDPAAHNALFGIPSDNSDIVFDRDWFHGPDGRSNRVYEMMGFDGIDVAIVNSYWDNLDYWHASYDWPSKVNKSDQPIQGSQSPSGSAGSTSFTVPQTTVYYGAANPATLPNTLTVSWTGTPDSSIATPEIAVYFDMEDNLQIVAPQGLSVTASAGTVSYTTASGSQNNAPAYAYCDEGDPMIPVDTQGHEAAAPLGCVRVNASGQIVSGGISTGTVYHGVDGEGCQCFIGGLGPGPYKIANNYISGSGIVMHFDNGGGYKWRGDYLIKQNTFHVPMTELNDAANGYAQDAGIPSDGYWYANRQLFEVKGGERYWLDGNQFLGGFSDVDHGLPFLFQSAPGDTYGETDIDITNNTIAHDQIGMGVVTHIANGDSSATPTFVNQRYRSYNNLIWDINGFIYSTVGVPVWGVGGFGEGSFASASGGAGEDFIFDHNTIYDLNGMTDQLWGGGTGPIEGVQITNNIIPYAIGAGGEDLFIQAWGELNSSACSSNPSTNESGTNCAFVAGAGNPDMIFKGNLLIPTWQKSQYPEGGAQLAISTIKADWPDYWAQNTIMTQSGALNALKAVGWAGISENDTIKRSWDAQGNYTGTVPDFRLLSQGLYNCCQSTDGKPVGADIDALEAAQGKVTLVGANQITGSTAIINYVAPDSASCSVDYSSTDPTLINSFTRVQDGGGATVRNVTLTALSPHTVYHYRVDCAVQQPTGQFVTR